MDATGIQAKINHGLGIAAQHLGTPFEQYRPFDALAPIQRLSLVATLLAHFDTLPGFDHRRPAAYGQPLYYLLADATDVLVGDYLLGQLAYFVAGLEPNIPPLCVACNRVVSVVRQQRGDAFGLQPRQGGETPATETPIMTGWPASVLLTGQGQAQDAVLPGLGKTAAVEVLLPAGVTSLLGSDVLTDDLGRRYAVDAAELSALGWRIRARVDAG